jgi:hypothetical protein
MVSKTSDAANPGCEKMSRRRRRPWTLLESNQTKKT